MNYYDSGFPYSEQLYHHGIKGQRWGVRRYQNEDGSLTTIGKMRYGVSEVRRVLGSKIKAVNEVASLNYKRKHLNKMTQEELLTELKRQQALTAIGEEKRKQKFAKRDTERAKKIVSDILESGAKTISSKAFNALASKIFDKKDSAVRNLADVLTDGSATIQEIRNAKEKYETAIKFNREKAYNEYVQNFNKEFMDNYSKKKGKGATLPTKDVIESTNEYAQLLKEISGSGGGGGKKKKKGGGGN